MSIDPGEAPLKDFHPVTGKLVNMPDPPEPDPEPEAVPIPGPISAYRYPPPPPLPKAPSVLTNPLGLAPAGSKPGRISAVDGFRTAAAGVLACGFMTIATQVGTFFVGHPEFLGPHAGDIIKGVTGLVAATVALSHLAHAYAGDSKPRVNADPNPR